MLKQLRITLKSRFVISLISFLIVAGVSTLVTSYGLISIASTQDNITCLNCAQIVEFVDCAGLKGILDENSNANNSLLAMAHNINICSNVRAKCGS